MRHATCVPPGIRLTFVIKSTLASVPRPSLMNRAEAEGRGTPRPNHILIFQEDHELASDSRSQLVEEVRKTVLHEIGHHFGMDEGDLDELGYG